MLSHLIIKDFAIIENINVDLEPGLNIITGETGAGKSIIIEAISLALGNRADKTMVRSGSQKAVIQLVFGNDTVITREINSNGKSISKINGEIVSLLELSSRTAKLADIHGQYDHQSLLDASNHIDIIDAYNITQISPLKEKTFSAFTEYDRISCELQKLIEKENTAKREMDFIKFESDEINRIDPKPDEDKGLSARLKILQNSEKIHSALNAAYTALNENPIGNAKTDLDSLAEYSDELRNMSERLSSAYYDLGDIGNEIRTYLDSMDYSSDTLNETIERLDSIERLKAKHKVGDINELLEYKSAMDKKLAEIENYDSKKADLISREEIAKEEFFSSSKELSFQRRETAKELEGKISDELKELSFNNSDFKVDFRMTEPGPSGVDKVEFMISPNKGLPLLPLSKIVSGGEMSRIMLAFKSILGDYDRIPTMIFDEIDSGISGKTASIVGEKMKKMAQKHQIICITHLPQIAAFSNSHYMIQKKADDDMTYTTVTKLDKNEHIKEIARLLGGRNITDNTLANARELIEQSQ